LNPTLAALLLALGISEKPADETAALNAALAAAKTLQDTLASLQTNVAALTARADTPDPARFAPVATLTALQSEHAALQAQLAALTAKTAAAELDQVIESARTAGKITPALESWARSYGSKDLAGLTAYLANAPVIVKPGTQTGGKSPAGGSGKALDTTDAKAVAEAALSYQTQQAQAGITVDTVCAVNYVLTNNGGNT
jgi:phage I-like protein